MPLEKIILGTLAMKQQWIDSMAAVCIWYQKEQEATKQERQLMETWANYKNKHPGGKWQKENNRNDTREKEPAQHQSNQHNHTSQSNTRWQPKY